MVFVHSIWTVTELVYIGNFEVRYWNDYFKLYYVDVCLNLKYYSKNIGFCIDYTVTTLNLTLLGHIMEKASGPSCYRLALALPFQKGNQFDIMLNWQRLVMLALTLRISVIRMTGYWRKRRLHYLPFLLSPHVPPWCTTTQSFGLRWKRMGKLCSGGDSRLWLCAKILLLTQINIPLKHIWITWDIASSNCI